MGRTTVGVPRPESPPVIQDFFWPKKEPMGFILLMSTFFSAFWPGVSRCFFWAGAVASPVAGALVAGLVDPVSGPFGSRLCGPVTCAGAGAGEGDLKFRSARTSSKLMLLLAGHTRWGAHG